VDSFPIVIVHIISIAASKLQDYHSVILTDVSAALLCKWTQNFIVNFILMRQRRGVSRLALLD